MKVLSVRQPWAWLIMQGYKDIENRTWQTPHRGKLAIHASGSFDYSFFDFEDDSEEPLRPFCSLVRDHFGIRPGTKRITRNKQEFKAILGTVHLTDCITANDTRPDIPSPWCFYCGYAWKLEKPEQWEKPITGINGKLNIWNYSEQQTSTEKETILL